MRHPDADAAVPATDHPVPAFRRAALAACMFLTIAAWGFAQPIAPLYLRASGLSDGQIGLVSGVGAGVALLMQPLLGWLSDRMDARRPLMAVAAIGAFLAFSAFRYAHGLLAFTLLMAVGTNGFFYLNAAGGVLVGRMVRSSGAGGGAYAGYRAWGSVGYVIVTLLIGWLLTNHGGGGLDTRADMDVVFLYAPLLFVAIAVAAALAPDRRTAPAEHAAGDSPLPPSLRRYLLAFFLYSMAINGTLAYLSLFMRHVGASAMWMNATWAAGAAMEVAMMARMGRLSDRFGRRPVLAIAFLVMPLRVLLYIPAPGPLWVLLVQMLEGLNFAIVGTVGIALVNDIATDRNRGRAQARLAAANGLAVATGPLVCATLVQAGGFTWMLTAMAAIGAVAAALFLGRVDESHPHPDSLAAHVPPALRPVARALEGGRG